MKTIEESIAIAMDYGQNVEIVPYLPYILQDFWELGSDVERVIHFVRKHCGDYTMLHVLDLGCGKGAVAVKLATAFKCNCYGIDGIPEFIAAAKEKALVYGVETLCRFEVGDIRREIYGLGTFDVIILSAVGQVFGDYYTTLAMLSERLTPDGIIVIGDAYIDDTSMYPHPALLSRRAIVAQIGQAGMVLVDEAVGGISDGTQELENQQKRCKELIAKHPEKTTLFESYIQIQGEEYDALENKVIGTTMVVKKQEFCF